MILSWFVCHCTSLPLFVQVKKDERVIFWTFHLSYSSCNFKMIFEKITFIPDIQCKTKLLKMKHEACIVPNNPSVKVGVGKLVERFLKQAATWTTIYLWGYFALSPGWLFAPLILSVLRWVWDQIWYCSRKMKLKVN